MITGIEPEVVAAVPAETSAKPKLTIVSEDDRYGQFAVEPLPRGFGHTLGNALRRVLLGSLPGAAIAAVQIEGIQHEYSSIPDVREDVSEILLNMKGVRLRAHAQRPGVLRLDVRGPGQVMAGDIQASADYDIVNPEVYLATLNTSRARLSIQIHVRVGAGYQQAGSTDGMPIGYLPLDAIFTPTRKVNYTVDKTRVGQVTDYERLNVEVWTDGSKSPVEAVREAAGILVESFTQFTVLGPAATAAAAAASSIPPALYNMPIEKLELSARTLNCLKRSKINKVGEILEMTEEDLLRIKNFGEKSLEELNGRLTAMGIARAKPAEEAEAAPAAEAPAEAAVAAEPAEAKAETPAGQPAEAPPSAPKKGREKVVRGKETYKDLAALRAIFMGEPKEQAQGGQPSPGKSDEPSSS